MKKVIFDNLMIADFHGKKAYSISFIEGINVVTSVQNKYGKSSIIKSLYHTLGAEVRFDADWGKERNLYVLDFKVDDKKYKMMRLVDLFLIIDGDGNVIKAASRVGILAPVLEEIFDFGIYLPNRRTTKMELAYPVMSYIPYYIDQDDGWNGLYNSFKKLGQYKTKDRTDSLYFHLGVYTKRYLQLKHEREQVETEKKAAELQYEQARISLRFIDYETNSIADLTDSTFEKEQQVSTKDIEDLVKKLNESRSRIQKLESELLQLNKQKDAIISIKSHEQEKAVTPVQCPNCGYTLDEEIQAIVFEKYQTESLKFALDQITYLIKDCSERLQAERAKHLKNQTELRVLEETKKQEASEFDLFVKIKGLSAIRSRLTSEISDLAVKIRDCSERIKEYNKRLRTMKSQEDIDASYAKNLKQRLISMNCWSENHADKLKLLKPIFAQGTQKNMVVLAQNLALFDVIFEEQTAQTLFPFVIDSPRANETDDNNSRIIIEQILGLTSMPQVILATLDFDRYYQGDKTGYKIITVTRERALLDTQIYMDNAQTISNYMGMFRSLLGFQG